MVAIMMAQPNARNDDCFTGSSRSKFNKSGGPVYPSLLSETISKLLKNYFKGLELSGARMSLTHAERPHGVQKDRSFSPTHPCAPRRASPLV